MHKLLVCEYNSQYFVQTTEKFARSHNRETVTFINSGVRWITIANGQLDKIKLLDQIITIYYYIILLDYNISLDYQLKLLEKIIGLDYYNR